MPVSIISKDNIRIGSYKSLLIPLVLFVVLIALFAYIVNISYTKISAQVASIKSLRQDIAVFQNRIEGLRAFQDREFPDSDKLLAALPEENPSLWMLSQIKRKAEENIITIQERNTSFSSSEGSGIASGNITFSAQGGKENMINFLLTFPKIAPLSKIARLELSMDEEGTATTANVEISVYYAKLPQRLPEITEAVNKLTPEEEEMVGKLTKLELPEFTTLSPNSPFEVKDPFSFSLPSPER